MDRFFDNFPVWTATYFIVVTVLVIAAGVLA